MIQFDYCYIFTNGLQPQSSSLWFIVLLLLLNSNFLQALMVLQAGN